MKRSNVSIWNLVKKMDCASGARNGLANLISQYPSLDAAANAINDTFVDIFSDPPNWISVKTSLP